MADAASTGRCRHRDLRVDCYRSPRGDAACEKAADRCSRFQRNAVRFYGLTSSYVVMLAMIAAVVMAITTPLTLKSTKGMLEMQRLAPEMRKLQNEHRNDKAKLNEEMMKLYQDHKVNPMASCLPIVAQMPVFIIMFQVLHGLTYRPQGAALPVAQTVWRAFGNTAEAEDPGFIPRFLAVDSSLYEALFGQHDDVFGSTCRVRHRCDRRRLREP